MSATPTLAQAIATLQSGGEGGGFVIDAPAGWGQGRTLYGGMTAALCWAAAERWADAGGAPLPPLRSAQFAFVGPASGRLALVPTLLRRGRSATIVGVDAVGEAGLAARAIFTCGAARESAVAHDFAPAPAVPPPDACDPLFPPPHPGPDFAGQFDVRLAAGQRPFGGGVPEFTVWARLLEAEGADPLTALLALADALPPAAMVVFPASRVISTMTWSLDFDRLPTRAGAWVLLQSASESTADGYSRQAMRAWGEDGRRLLNAAQTVAIFV